MGNDSDHERQDLLPGDEGKRRKGNRVASPPSANIIHQYHRNNKALRFVAAAMLLFVVLGLSRSDKDGGSKDQDISRDWVYKPRGRQSLQPTVDQNPSLSATSNENDWGSWSAKLVRHPLSMTSEGDAGIEGQNSDIYAKFPNRDIPWDQLPSTAWQRDTLYLKEFTQEGWELVHRAQRAIVSEYHGQLDENDSWSNQTDMFRIMLVEDEPSSTQQEQEGNENGGPQTDKLKLSKNPDLGGSTFPSSWEGLKQRLLHAILTEDTFVFAMGGHSSAAGHGNHFAQSYTLQIQRILEPVLARLGVKHEARNFGNGGLGTLQNGFASGSVYGPDVDVLMWDSAMTEKESSAKLVFHMQGLLGGERVPVLWTLADKVAVKLHDRVDADVGVPGSGQSGIPKAYAIEELKDIPWAARYLRCSSEMQQAVCKNHEYSGMCWINRTDVGEPPKTQRAVPGGRASWHPGNRKHQLTGRVLAFTLLQVLKEVFEEWKELPDYKWPESKWHVTSRYNAVRDKIRDQAKDFEGSCNGYAEQGFGFLCAYPMKARTEFTPRAYPSLSNIRTLMPPEMAAEINEAQPPFYLPPDTFNPSLHPPIGEVDVLSIVESGAPFQGMMAPEHAKNFYKTPKFLKQPQVPIGKGVQLDTMAGDKFCDGSLNSWCGRGRDSDCLLYGHNDGRNGLLLDGYSGWLVLNIPDLQNGIIAMRLETWHPAGEVSKTQEWTSVNNEDDARKLEADSSSSIVVSSAPNNLQASENQTSIGDQRFLKAKEAKYCESFRFEYAIDGKITSLTHDEFTKRIKKVQRVVEIFMLLDDRSYTRGSEKEVEIAIRTTGCARDKVIKLSHVYWS